MPAGASEARRVRCIARRPSLSSCHRNKQWRQATARRSEVRGLALVQARVHELHCALIDKESHVTLECDAGFTHSDAPFSGWRERLRYVAAGNDLVKYAPCDFVAAIGCATAEPGGGVFCFTNGALPP